jgi:transposase
VSAAARTRVIGPTDAAEEPQIARDFDLTETAVREWLRQAERDAGTGDGGLTGVERAELAALRRENRRLRQDVEILKRATAFFAKETR